jgi:hypothetical protein
MRPPGALQLIRGKALHACYQQAGKDSRRPLPLPSIDTCKYWAKAISKQRLPSASERQSWRQTLSKLRKVREDISHFSAIDPSELAAFESVEKKIRAELENDWTQVAGYIGACGIAGWEEAGRSLRSRNAGDPLCVFTHRVLKELGIHRSEATVSEVLQGRRGVRLRIKRRTKLSAKLYV